MSALTILIIRHAEKQGEAWPGSGLMPDGVPDKKSLVIRGWQRAGNWSALFGAGLGGLDYPTPSVIYAADPAATTGDEPSQRPFETVIPLAARLDLTPDITYAVGQEANSSPRLSAKPAWCLSLGSTRPYPVPFYQLSPIVRPYRICRQSWDGTRFDVVLRFDRTSPEAPWSFRQLYPCLLSGDSATQMG